MYVEIYVKVYVQLYIIGALMLSCDISKSAFIVFRRSKVHLFIGSFNLSSTVPGTGINEKRVHVLTCELIPVFKWGTRMYVYADPGTPYVYAAPRIYTNICINNSYFLCSVKRVLSANLSSFSIRVILKYYT